MLEETALCWGLAIPTGSDLGDSADEDEVEADVSLDWIEGRRGIAELTIDPLSDSRRVAVMTEGRRAFCLPMLGLGRDMSEEVIEGVGELFVTFERWSRLVVTVEAELVDLVVTLPETLGVGVACCRDALRQSTEARSEAGLMTCFSSLLVSFEVVDVTRKPVLVVGAFEATVESKRSSTVTPISSEISFKAQFSKGSNPFKDRTFIHRDLRYLITLALASSTITLASIGRPSSRSKTCPTKT